MSADCLPRSMSPDRIANTMCAGLFDMAPIGGKHCIKGQELRVGEHRITSRALSRDGNRHVSAPSVHRFCLPQTSSRLLIYFMKTVSPPCESDAKSHGCDII